MEAITINYSSGIGTGLLNPVSSTGSADVYTYRTDLGGIWITIPGMKHVTKKDLSSQTSTTTGNISTLPAMIIQAPGIEQLPEVDLQEWFKAEKPSLEFWENEIDSYYDNL